MCRLFAQNEFQVFSFKRLLMSLILGPLRFLLLPF